MGTKQYVKYRGEEGKIPPGLAGRSPKVYPEGRRRPLGTFRREFDESPRRSFGELHHGSLQRDSGDNAAGVTFVFALVGNFVLIIVAGDVDVRIAALFKSSVTQFDQRGQHRPAASGLVGP